MTEKVEYPLYEMLSKGDEDNEWKKEFLPLRRAGALFDSGWVQVRIGTTVLLDNKHTARGMTEEDRDKIREAADTNSSMQ